MAIVQKEYHFHSAHRNTELENDKCWSLHGHTYLLTVILDNPKKKGSSTGLLFSEIDKKICPIVEVLDHSFICYKKDELYDILAPMGMRIYPLDFESSAENLAEHIYNLILLTGLPVLEVRLKETTSSTIIYKG